MAFRDDVVLTLVAVAALASGSTAVTGASAAVEPTVKRDGSHRATTPEWHPWPFEREYAIGVVTVTGSYFTDEVRIVPDTGRHGRRSHPHAR